jgi:DNA-binding MarR family transcriptional regulator
VSPTPTNLPYTPDDPYLARVLQAVLGLLALNERLVQHWSNHARAKDLTGAQAKVLIVLPAGEGVTMRALARRLASDASNLTVVIDRLEDRGLVARSQDDSDRRSRQVHLTSEGERVRNSFWTDLTNDPGPLAPLATEQLDALLATLETLTEP